MTARRVVVTGGSGFIGTHVVAALATAGHEVRNFDVEPPRDPSFSGLWTNLDVRDEQGCARAIVDFAPSWVVHLAARTDLDERVRLSGYTANTDGVRNLVRAVQAAGVERVVFASSSLVFTPGVTPRHDRDYSPSTMYGMSKVVGEEIVRAASLVAEWCFVRPTSIWGPWFGTPYRDFFVAVAKGRYLHAWGRHPSKSYGYVGNAVHQLLALLSAMKDDVHGKAFWLADYDPIDLYEWAQAIARDTRARDVRVVPYALLKAAAIGGDILQRTGWSNPPLTSFRLHNIVEDAEYDTTALEGIVGPLPFSWREGVRLTADWLSQQAVLGSDRPR